MGRKKLKTKSDYVLFNVHYDDGTLSSNRRVPASELSGPDGDEPAWAILQAQDLEISERSGKPRARIASVERAATK